MGYEGGGAEGTEDESVRELSRLMGRLVLGNREDRRLLQTRVCMMLLRNLESESSRSANAVPPQSESLSLRRLCFYIVDF